jgi:hypothetical protein
MPALIRKCLNVLVASSGMFFVQVVASVVAALFVSSVLPQGHSAPAVPVGAPLNRPVVDLEGTFVRQVSSPFDQEAGVTSQETAMILPAGAAARRTASVEATGIVRACAPHCEVHWQAARLVAPLPGRRPAAATGEPLDLAAHMKPIPVADAAAVRQVFGLSLPKLPLEDKVRFVMASAGEAMERLLK